MADRKGVTPDRDARFGWQSPDDFINLSDGGWKEHDANLPGWGDSTPPGWPEVAGKKEGE